jgi:4-hydroxy-L-threonine phosphate dehydrogenase PdxA
MSPLRPTPQLVVTQGDPEGIGPELLLRLGEAGLLHAGDLVVADLVRLQQLADALGAWAARGLAAVSPLVSHTHRDLDRCPRSSPASTSCSKIQSIARS